VNVISRIRNKMSLQKLKFSEFNKKKRKFSEFSLNLCFMFYAHVCFGIAPVERYDKRCITYVCNVIAQE